jgi:hypothetical protein
MEQERAIATTGVLGMNLFALEEEPVMVRVGYFFVILIPVITVTLYIMLKSRRLPDFLVTSQPVRCSLSSGVDRFRVFPVG